MNLFIATPMYGGQCYGAYTDSLIKLCVFLAQSGIEFRFFPIFNESHIDRARNACAEHFLRSGFTHLLFVDADESGYAPEQVVDLMNRNKDIICVSAPKKNINWKRVVEAVKLGFADDDPEGLARIVGDMVFTPALNDDSNRTRTIYDLTKLHEGGSGFMLIKREVLLKIRDENPDLWFHKWYDKRDTMVAFFDAKLETEWQVSYRRFLSEDYDFCRLAREVGFEIWLAPWIKLIHHGYYQFQGDIEAIASVIQAKQQEAAE